MIRHAHLFEIGFIVTAARKERSARANDLFTIKPTNPIRAIYLNAGELVDGSRVGEITAPGSAVGCLRGYGAR